MVRSGDRRQSSDAAPASWHYWTGWGQWCRKINFAPFGDRTIAPGYRADHGRASRCMELARKGSVWLLLGCRCVLRRDVGPSIRGNDGSIVWIYPDRITSSGVGGD